MRRTREFRKHELLRIYIIMEFRVLKAEWTVQNNDIPWGGANRRTHLFHVEKKSLSPRQLRVWVTSLKNNRVITLNYHSQMTKQSVLTSRDIMNHLKHSA